MLPHADARAEGAAPPPESSLAQWPGRVHRLGAALLVTAIVGLELRAVLGPYEDWPFTSAPMFARYQTPGAPVFELSFYVEDAEGVTVELEPLRHLGTGELGFRRHFFARYYGSTDPQHPSWHLPDDNPAKFEQRIAEWMRLVVSVYTRRAGHPPRRIWLEASKLENGRLERRPLFEYAPSTARLSALSRTAGPSQQGRAR